jgi:hypothetical protein
MVRVMLCMRGSCECAPGVAVMSGGEVCWGGMAVVLCVNSALVRRWVRRATPVLLRQSDAPVISLPSEPPPLFELVAVLRRYERGTACWFFGM